MNNIIRGHCMLELYDDNIALESSLTDVCIDSAIKEGLFTTVFSSEHTEIEFGRLFIEKFGDEGITKVTSSHLCFKNVNHQPLERIYPDIRACAAAGCKLVILVGDCVRNIPDYDNLAEDLSIALLAMDTRYAK